MLELSIELKLHLMEGEIVHKAVVCERVRT